MKKLLFISILLLTSVLVIGGATFLFATADPGHTNTGPKCEVVNPTTGREECPYNSALGSTDVLLNWEMKGDSLPSDPTQRICLLSCRRNDDLTCNPFFKVDGQGYASSTGRDIYPKDSVKVFQPKIGNIYRAGCLASEKAKSQSTKSLNAKMSKPTKADDIAIARSGEMEITQGTGQNPGGKLDIEPLNGTVFYPGQTADISWKISNKLCESGKLSIFTYPILNGLVVYTSPSRFDVGNHGSSGHYQIPFDLNHRHIPLFVEGRMMSGACNGDTDSFIINIAQPEVQVSSPTGGTFYSGDTITVTWNGKPPVTNDLALATTLINENKTFGINGSFVNQSVKNDGIFTYKVPAGTPKRTAIISLCYEGISSEEAIPFDQSDWRNFGRGIHMICSDTGDLSIGGDRK